MNAAEIYGFLVSQSTHLAALFFVIWGLVALCRGKSAHLRYLLWAVILVKCLLPPVFTIPVVVLPGPVVTSPVVESTEGPAEGRVFWTANTPLPPVVEPVVTTSVDLSTITPAPVIEHQGPDRAPWWRTLETRQRVLLVWGAGVVVILLGTSVRAWRFARRLRRSRVEIDDVLAKKIFDLSQRFCPGLTVKTYQLEGTGQPFVWGVFNGAIYLPANFCQASTEHKRCSVLLHELAHVARLDPLVNFIQIVTQAVYWFHPLVWVANKRIRAEREKCCDEIAIARFDTTPKEYGSAIVDTLMHEYESRMAVPTLAVAGPVKNIEDRIKTIMKPGKQFYSRPTFKVWIIVLLLAAILTPTTIALMPRRADTTEAGSVSISKYRATWSNGLSVELVGICEYPSQGKSWWGPDGTPLTQSIQTQNTSSYGSKDPGYEFVFRTSGHESFKIDSIKGCDIQSRLDVEEPEGLTAYRVHISSQHKTTDITLATPTGAWKTVHVSKASNASTSATVRGKTIILAGMIPAGDDVIVSCTDELGYEDATRIIAIDSAGQAHRGKALTDTGIRGVRQRTIRYEDLSLTDVAEVRFQVCPYAHATLKNILLPPNSKIDSENQLINRGPMVPASSFKDMDIREILGILGDDSGIPVVADAEVSSVTSVNFDTVPLEVALDRVLAGTDYSWTKKEDAYLVSAVVKEQRVPASASTLSFEDRRELVRLMNVYARVAFSNDLQGAEAIFNFENEAQKKRVLDMIGQEKRPALQAENDAQSVHVVQIEPVADDVALVSALCPLGGGYITHSVSWVRTDNAWKVAMDLASMMKTQTQARTMGAEAYGRQQLKAQIQLWEDAQGPGLVSLYESTKKQLQRQRLMCQYAKLRHLDMLTGLDLYPIQRQLDDLASKTPEAYRAEMLYRLKRQFGPPDQYGKLALRILPNAAASGQFPGQMTEAAEQRARERLKNNGPLDASSRRGRLGNHIWSPVRSQPGTSFPDAIIETYQGQQYVLASNQPEEIMTADGSWGILAVSPQVDAMGRRAIALELDQPGGEKLRQITGQNIDRAMAIIVDGQVLSAPTIKATIGPHVLITGQFTDQEVRDMLISLQKGMRATSVDTPSEKTGN